MSSGRDWHTINDFPLVVRPQIMRQVEMVMSSPQAGVQSNDENTGAPIDVESSRVDGI